MESGDICSIVAVEIAEQSIYFERLLRYHKGRGYIRLPEFLNAGFASVIEYIRKGKTKLTSENVYQIFIASDYLLVSNLKQECSAYIKEMAKDPAVAISLWISCRGLYWPEVGEMAYQKILENFGQVFQSAEFLQLDFDDVKHILEDDGLNCLRERMVLTAVENWVQHSSSLRLPFAFDLLTTLRLGLMPQAEIDQISSSDFVKLVPEFAQLLFEWPRCLFQPDSEPLLSEPQRQRLTTPRLPHEVSQTR
ncbi:unnamed protein product [Protopolystoma xenopodis]|uniref:BACK domain-containing protein n=1 Tax=Protopolystoma xenopodis TaxID=117903 RepID=A0A448X1J1_9PLAT|nr:unnamed protein product [Protopolystoma xenopodis]